MKINKIALLAAPLTIAASALNADSLLQQFGPENGDVSEYPSSNSSLDRRVETTLKTGETDYKVIVRINGTDIEGQTRNIGYEAIAISDVNKYYGSSSNGFLTVEENGKVQFVNLGNGSVDDNIAPDLRFPPNLEHTTIVGGTSNEGNLNELLILHSSGDLLNYNINTGYPSRSYALPKNTDGSKPRDFDGMISGNTLYGDIKHEDGEFTVFGFGEGETTPLESFTTVKPIMELSRDGEHISLTGSYLNPDVEYTIQRTTDLQGTWEDLTPLTEIKQFILPKYDKIEGEQKFYRLAFDETNQ